jgi:hypothetical protein
MPGIVITVISKLCLVGDKLVFVQAIEAEIEISDPYWVDRIKNVKNSPERGRDDPSNLLAVSYEGASDRREDLIPVCQDQFDKYIFDNEFVYLMEYNGRLFVWDSTDAEKCYPSIRTLCMFSK